MRVKRVSDRIQKPRECDAVDPTIHERVDKEKRIIINDCIAIITIDGDDCLSQIIREHEGLSSKSRPRRIGTPKPERPRGDTQTRNPISTWRRVCSIKSAGEGIDADTSFGNNRRSITGYSGLAFGVREET